MLLIMELTQNLNKTKIPIAISEIKSGDIIYLSSKDDAIPYSVLDVGTPFILIENLKSHFANLYRPSVVYKEM